MKKISCFVSGYTGTSFQELIKVIRGQSLIFITNIPDYYIPDRTFITQIQHK